ncbi:MAG: hypothetical protein Q8S13_13800, partial [Dehalococcoidia bacterium]|nr:hypothetical protein [Dehalococcoidia bacterium]
MTTPRGWTRNAHNCLRRTLDAPGYRVVLFEKRIGGGFYRAVWDGTKRTRKALDTTDSAEAERLGLDLLAKLLAGGPPVEDAPVRLGDVWERYRTTCAGYLDNLKGTKQDAEHRARCLLAFFGAS